MRGMGDYRVEVRKMWYGRLMNSIQTTHYRSIVRFKKGQQVESKRTKRTVGCMCHGANQACTCRGSTLVTFITLTSNFHVKIFLKYYYNLFTIMTKMEFVSYFIKWDLIISKMFCYII